MQSLPNQRHTNNKSSKSPDDYDLVAYGAYPGVSSTAPAAPRLASGSKPSYKLSLKNMHRFPNLAEDQKMLCDNNQAVASGAALCHKNSDMESTECFSVDLDPRRSGNKPHPMPDDQYRGASAADYSAAVSYEQKVWKTISSCCNRMI